ncbi:MAG: VanZ family protein [Paludibacter sp.]
MKNFSLNYWKSTFVVCCILYLSFAPPSTFNGIPTFNNEDKLVHFLMYAGLSCLLIFDFRLANKNNKTKSLIGFLLCFAFPVLLGGTIEILQPLYFGRGGSWFDLSANVTGIIAAWVFMHVFERLITKIFVWNKK